MKCKIALMRYINWGAYGSGTIALVALFVFFVGASDSSHASGPVTCTDPMSCVVNDQTNGVYSDSEISDYMQYLWDVLTNPSTAYSETSPSGTTLDDALSSLDSTSQAQVESELTDASWGVGDAFYGSLALDMAEASTGVLLPLAAGTTAYLVYKLVFGSGSVGYQRLPLDHLGADGIVTDLSDTDVAPTAIGFQFDPPNCQLGDSICQNNFDLVDEYEFSTPTYTNDYYWSGYGPDGLAPYTYSGLLVHGTGVNVSDCYLGEDNFSPAVTDWSGDFTSQSQVSACSGGVSYTTGAPLVNVAYAIAQTLQNVPTHSVVPINTEDDGTSSLDYISPYDMYGNLTDPSYTDPGGEVATVTINEPSVTTTPNPGVIGGLSSLQSDPCLTALMDYLMDSTYPNPACSAGAPTTISLPQPTVNQTCDDYVTGLATIGYVGDASCVSLTTPKSWAGPNSPVSITWTPPSSTLISLSTQPGFWPAVNPTISPGQSLTIQANPSGAPTVPGSGGGNGHPSNPVPIGGIGAPGCSCPPINLTPLTGLDYSSSWPFGIFSWLEGIFNPYTTGFDTADAPTVTLGTPNGGSQVIDFNNSIWDSLHDTYFTIVEFLMSLGAIAFLAIRVIGIGGGD